MGMPATDVMGGAGLQPKEMFFKPLLNHLSIHPASSGCASSVLLLCDHEAFLDVLDNVSIRQANRQCLTPIDGLLLL